MKVERQQEKIGNALDIDALMVQGSQVFLLPAVIVVWTE
jgi:hypothetical protein